MVNLDGTFTIVFSCFLQARHGEEEELVLDDYAYSANLTARNWEKQFHKLQSMKI